MLARETGFVILATVRVFCNVRLLMHHLLSRKLQSTLHITCKCVSEVVQMYVLIKQQTLAHKVVLLVFVYVSFA